MNYTNLVIHINAIAVDSFSTVMVNMFIDQAEEKIYESVPGITAFRKTSTGTTTTGNQYLGIPTDLVYVRSLVLDTGSGSRITLLNKDDSFIQDAYPTVATKATCKHYAFFSNAFFLLGPTPDQAYTVHLTYGYHPASIVTAATTWLGDNFSAALLNGALIEAVRAQKGEPDIIEEYEKLYLQSIGLLKNYADGRLETDVYRSGGG